MQLIIYTAYLLPMEHRPESPAILGDVPSTVAGRTHEPNGVGRMRQLLSAALTRVRLGRHVTDGRTEGAEGMGVAALPGTR